MLARKQQLLLLLIALCPGIYSEIIIDGLLDEEEWATARVVNKFYEVYPYSLETGHTDTKILIKEDEKGMYFGFINIQPKDTIRLNQHQRDQGVRPPIGDQNGVTIDFDNDARTGSKGDYIFRDYENETEVISIMFEMKNESDATTTKRKNEDFLKRLQISLHWNLF